MSDEIKAQESEETQGSDETREQGPSMTDVLAQLEAIKQAQSGSDKKVKELSEALTLANKEKEALQKESMNEKERAAFELEQQKKVNETTAAELAKRELALDKASVITDLEVPKELAPYVQGDSKETILSSAKALMETFAAEVAKGVEKKLATDTELPISGDDGKPAVPGDWAVIDAMTPGRDKDKAIADFVAAMDKQ